MKAYLVGAKIAWNWAGGVVEGQIVQVYFKRIEKIIKGKKIVRIGSKDRPAYLVRSESGNLALKLHSELKPASKARVQMR